MPKELAIDLASLALYDIVMYGDGSGSMETCDAEHIDDLNSSWLRWRRWLLCLMRMALMSGSSTLMVRGTTSSKQGGRV